MPEHDTRRTLDVSGLPEPATDALREIVRRLRSQAVRRPRKPEPAPLPHWGLGAKGSLSRRDIYGESLVDD